METSLLNGFTFTHFHQLDSGEWVVADANGNARVLPTKEFGITLRRRILACWLFVFAVAVVVAIASGSPFKIGLVVALAWPSVWMLAHAMVARLPRSDYEFARREWWYQSRGLVAMIATLVLLSAAACVFLSFQTPGTDLLVVGLVLLVIGGGTLTLWRWARRRNASA